MIHDYYVARIAETTAEKTAFGRPYAHIRFELTSPIIFRERLIDYVSTYLSLDNSYRLDRFTWAIGAQDLRTIPDPRLLNRYCRILIREEEYSDDLTRLIVRDFRPVNPPWISSTPFVVPDDLNKEFGSELDG
jgi:hypothetical protein